MDYRFTDLVDIEAFRSMLKSFYEATGILHGLVDDRSDVISAIGWQDACTDFHRRHPISNQRCLESNRYLGDRACADGYVGCACKNGLMDYATAIEVDGRKLATLYFGQLLHEPPDLEFFRGVAQDCGFNEEAYLAAIRKIPVIPKERIEPIMAFYTQLAQMLAASGLDRLRQRQAEKELADLNCALAQRIEERTAELEARNRELAAEVEEHQRTAEALRQSQVQLQAILDSSPIGIGWSFDGKVEYLNSRFTDLFGYSLEDIPTLDHWYQLAYPDERYRNEVVGAWRREVEAAKVAGTAAPPLETPVVCKEGSVRYVVVSVSWIGERRLANFSDITQRWLAEQHDQASSRVLELIARGASLEATLDVLVRGEETNGNGLLCSILLVEGDGRRLRTAAGPSLPEFYNRAVDGIEIGPSVGSCGAAAFLRRRVIVPDILQHPNWADFKDLAFRAGLASCWSEPILSSTGELLGTFAMYHRRPFSPGESDLRRLAQAANLASIAIERHRTLRELELQARTDFLTGLANRRHFLELAGVAAAHARRYGEPFSLLMLDIDFFKKINDGHGHRTGDQVLLAVAKVLQGAVRAADLASRVGGEEFAVMLPNTSRNEACRVAERLRSAAALAETRGEDGVPIHVTLSIGVSTLVGRQADVEALMIQADAALYTAKNSGRDRVCVSE